MVVANQQHTLHLGRFSFETQYCIGLDTDAGR